MRFDLRLSERKVDRYVRLFISVYIFIFSYIAYLKFTSFSFTDFDLAIYDQISWNMGRSSLYNSILGVNFLGNHLTFIVFLFAPIYKLFPHPITLLVAQTIALGLGAWPLYLMAKRALGVSWAFLVVFSYLFYPPLAYLNLFEFHPVAFSTLFFLYMFYFYYIKRFTPFVIFMFLSMLCQENVSLGVAAFGFYALIARQGKKWALTPICCGLAYFILSIFILLPYFNRNTLQFISLYSHLGRSYSEIFTNIFLHPIQVLKIAFQQHKVFFVVQLFAPLFFVPLAGPAALIPAVPFFMQHFLSSRINEVTIYYHYAAEIIPFVFVAFVFGLKRLLSVNVLAKNSAVIAFFLIGVFLASSLWLGPHFHLSKAMGKQWVKDDRDRIKEAFVEEVPREASVVTSFEFLPHLTHRRFLYSFHHVYMGFYTMSNKPYLLPQDAQYALLDFNDRLTFSGFYNTEAFENIKRFLSEGKWGVVDVLDSIVLFEKGKESAVALYEVLDTKPELQNKTSYNIADSFELLGYDVGKVGNRWRLTLYWHCIRKTSRDISVFFQLEDKDTKLIYESFAPLCYRIYPTYAWKEGEYIKETKFLPFADDPEKKGLIWKMGFYDFRSGEDLIANDKDIFGRIGLDLS